MEDIEVLQIKQRNIEELEDIGTKDWMTIKSNSFLVESLVLY